MGDRHLHCALITKNAINMAIRPSQHMPLMLDRVVQQNEESIELYKTGAQFALQFNGFYI
jgi:hypothetical protein